MLVYRRLLLVTLVGLALSCTFNPVMDPDYWPCKPDGTCEEGCECFDGRVCIPEGNDPTPALCEWCPDGYANCDKEAKTGCEARLDDPKSCGSCPNVCDPGKLCEIGACVDSCREGFTQCGMTCLDALTDPENCGKCGNACRSDQVCDGGECTEDCSGELKPCNGSCTDKRTDPENCGNCGTVCVLPNARPKCELGMCLVDTCLEPFGDCDRELEGCETDLKVSDTDCGRCGNACGQNSSCLAGVCVCDDYFADCDLNPDTGCEIMVKTDPMNCGDCGKVCDQPPGDYCDENFLMVHPRLGDCAEYACSYEPLPSECQFGCQEMVCLGDPCGDVRCDPGEICIDGVCACGGTGPDCVGEQVCCGTACVDVWNNPEHCGECFMACGQHAICEGVECQCSSPEFADCNTSWVDGCEVYLNYSSENCGECGNNCGQNAQCISGYCSCLPGFSNCDGAWTNGCEGDLNTPESCGTCYNICGTDELCCEGSCTDVLQNNLNCGFCGNDCPAGEICCDGGCVDTLVSSDHCGRCFNTCVETLTCDQGSCGSVGVDCGGGNLCNPAQEQVCCYSSAGGMDCNPANNCTAHMFNCDGPEDCEEGFVCCAVLASMEATACKLADDCATTFLCNSDLQCLETNPNTPMCCPENIQGIDVFVCMSACP